MSTSMYKVKMSLGTTTFLLSLLLVGCLEPKDAGIQTETVGTPTQTPADFNVSPQTVNSNSTTSTQTDQNSSTPVVETPIVSETTGVDDVFTFDFTINNGSAVTSDSNLQLSLLAPPWYSEVKIGTQADCSDGVWQPLQSSLTYGAPLLNAVNSVSVRYRDYDQNESACLVKSIRHDNQGPVILISKYPLISLEEGSAAEIIYSVTDASDVRSVSCSMNTLTKTCAGGTSTVQITPMPEGSYVFKIEATDELGNSSAQQVSWSVVSTTKKLTQSIDIKDDRKVDILFVVDNSGSMQYEQKSMANRVGSMLSVLQGLDWQIAVTTTDPTAPCTAKTTPGKVDTRPCTSSLTDGRLIPIYGSNGQLFLDSTSNLQDAQYKLGMTLQRPETGSGSEQAIFATYRFVERSQGSDASYRSFFRTGANFAVVVISDEDESANGIKNDPQNLIKLVSTTFQQQKVFTWHSIITRPGDSQCLKTYGATFAERYNSISNLTGGLIGSVCETDYAKQLTGVAQGIRSMNMSLGLSCQPLSQLPITVKRDGVAVSSPFTIEGHNLKFQEVLGVGSYSVEYHCLK